MVQRVYAVVDQGWEGGQVFSNAVFEDRADAEKYRDSLADEWTTPAGERRVSNDYDVEVFVLYAKGEEL